MDMKQMSNGYIEQLKCAYLRERPKMLLDIAIQKLDLENGEINIPGGGNVPASRFCVELNYYMERIYSAKECPEDPDERNKSMWAGVSNAEDSYQIAALLLTLERTNRSGWTFGAYLRCLLDTFGFKVQRPEWIALVAQARVYANSPFDEYTRNLMWHNPIAIALYAAETAVACGSLHNSLISEKDIPQELIAQFEAAVRPNPKELLESMMDTFVPAYLGENKEAQLTGFKRYLNNKKFYDGPATAASHGNFDSGLAIHTVDVLYKLIDLVRPQTAKEMGKLVLLSVCHDLSEVDVFTKSYRSQAVEGPAYINQNGTAVVDQKHTLKWPDQRPYHVETKLVWKREDALPMEAGMKSVHIALGFFCNGILSEEVTCAIANHRRDSSLNPLCDFHFIKNDLCRNLHIADFLASMLGSKVV